MSASLSNDDRCAVDLLLENAQPPSQGMSSCFTKAASSTMQERLTRVETLLRLLDSDVPPEPSADLAARTVARCTQRAGVIPPSDQILPTANAQ